MRRARERLVSAARSLGRRAARAYGGPAANPEVEVGTAAASASSPAPPRRLHHPRVSIPRELPPPETYPHDVPIDPCTPEDAATMIRQIRKRRAYPVGCASRCRHGFPQAYLHAPMHVPARHADVLDETPPEYDTRASDDDETPHASSHGRSKRARARRRASSPTRGVVAEHALGWLACPLLVRAVDALEKDGAIDAVADVTRADSHLSAALERSHATAPDTRRWLLPDLWRRALEDRPTLRREPNARAEHSAVDDNAEDEPTRPRGRFAFAARVLFETGVAGVSLRGDTGGWRGNRVKCLHAHLGDRLVRGSAANPVGEMVLRRVRREGTPAEGSDECWRECARADDPRFARFAR